MSIAPEKVEEYAEILSTLGNVNRLRIVILLRTGTKKVGDISRHINQSQSSTSQHLAALRAQNIVNTKRSGNEIYYYFNPDGPLNFINWEMFT